MRKFALFAMLLGLTGFSIGCEQSVQEEREDLREAHQEAAEEVGDEMQDVDKAAREGEEEIIEAERDLEDAKREQAEKKLDDADTPPPVTPPNP